MRVIISLEEKMHRDRIDRRKQRWMEKKSTAAQEPISIYLNRAESTVSEKSLGQKVKK